jgi:hypothetical protein
MLLLLDQTLLSFPQKADNPVSYLVADKTPPVVLVSMVAVVEALQSSPVPVVQLELVLYQPIAVSKVTDSVLELAVTAEGSL